MLHSKETANEGILGRVAACLNNRAPPPSVHLGALKCSYYAKLTGISRKSCDALNELLGRENKNCTECICENPNLEGEVSKVGK